MRLHELLAALHDFRMMPVVNPEVTSIEMDSREVKVGSLFICVKGYTVDGHHYVKQAVARGAVAVIVEKDVETDVPVIKVKSTQRAMAVLANAFYDNPTSKLQLIGITGTNGKTSVSHLIEALLRRAGRRTGLIGTLGMKMNEATFETKNTTPDSLTLQKMFTQMVEAEIETAVMEVSSHALHMGRVHGCQYDVTVFTNLTQDHLDYHKTMDAYRAAKSLLFSQLGHAYDVKHPKYAILNVDDAATAEYIVASQGIVITYGIDNEADLMACDVKTTSRGTTFTLLMNDVARVVQMGLVGKFNVYNMLATLGAGLAAGLQLDAMIEDIPHLSGVPGRFELVDAGQSFSVIVDYAHTPDSLENVLKTIKAFTEGKIYCLIGCGGDRDKTKRPMMAEIASHLSDYPIFTSDNPRTEDPIAILKDMEAGIVQNNHQTIVDRKEAITYAINQAQPKDVVLIAGKGHETYQIIGEKVLDFDDREMARAAILLQQQ
ncbi:MAG: UDP-N-acetylmuramoyl-L-alanyl-D-glutamate--2,6-diaminopimelate ligase [Defluviitaleaceae bacterium]|nr:UDP-N-acetylmuramoyl-L-alanyl-D-glutamate--2,6-diaminopimelate ligase [Defluviitaleaceae bacterium]